MDADEIRDGISKISTPVPDRTIESAEIFQGTKEVLIRHGDEVYRLIVTRNNRLLLHK